MLPGIGNAVAELDPSSGAILRQVTVGGDPGPFIAVERRVGVVRRSQRCRFRGARRDVDIFGRLVIPSWHHRACGFSHGKRR